jgi:hypothetical protein
LEIFPRLSEPERVFSGIAELKAALDDHGYRLRCYEVRKERYKRKAGRVTVEWAELEVARRRFWSVAATGPKLEKVAARAAKLPNNFTLVGGTVSSLPSWPSGVMESSSVTSARGYLKPASLCSHPSSRDAPQHAELLEPTTLKVVGPFVS